MPDDINVRNLQSQILSFTKKLQKIGVDLTPMLSTEINMATGAMVNHARANHYFVGVGRRTPERLALDPEMKNDDGSLRFKTRTANLMNSINKIPATTNQEGIIEGRFVAGMEYAPDVEYGTARSRAFPFMRPAFENVKPKFIQNLHDRFRNLMGRYFRGN